MRTNRHIIKAHLWLCIRIISIRIISIIRNCHTTNCFSSFVAASYRYTLRDKISFGWLLAVICCLCCPLPDIAAAKERFIIDAQMLPSTKQTYDILVTIENQGEDWEGAARLMLDNVYRESGKCAYDTVLSLPQGSTKQFTIRMPKATIESTEGTIHISLMEKENKIPMRQCVNCFIV